MNDAGNNTIDSSIDSHIDSPIDDITGVGDAATGPIDSAMPRSGPPSLRNSTALSTFGHLAWLGWTWLVVAFCFAVALTAIGIWGSLDSSLWQDAVAGWQRWLFLAAGVTTVPVFAPIFVGNGVTRAQLSSSSIIAMVILAVLGAVYVTVGYVAESIVFDLEGWNHVLEGGQDAGAVATAGHLGLAQLLAFGAYFTAGWLLGVAWHRRGEWPLALLVVPAVASMLLTEALLPNNARGVNPGFLQDSSPPLTLAAPAILALIAGGCTLARWGTRGAAVAA